jgi:iron complex transport system substrate-binding protein
VCLADVTEAKPDVVVVAPCGFRLGGAVEQARRVLAEVPGVPVWAIDADAIVVRPGPRLVDGVAALAAIMHPGAVPAPPPGHIQLVQASSPSHDQRGMLRPAGTTASGWL